MPMGSYGFTTLCHKFNWLYTEHTADMHIEIAYKIT